MGVLGPKVGFFGPLYTSRIHFTKPLLFFSLCTVVVVSLGFGGGGGQHLDNVLALDVDLCCIQETALAKTEEKAVRVAADVQRRNREQAKAIYQQLAK